MLRTVHGTVRGKTIELDEDLDVPQGQKVEVQVKIIESKKSLPGPPPGWRPSSTQTVAGALADLGTAEEDRLLEEIHQDRKREGRLGFGP